MTTEEAPITALTAVMSPRDGADEQVDWTAVGQAWGVGFPSDYMAFMAVYGAGGVDESVGIHVPEATTQPPEGPGFGSMAGETAIMRRLWSDDGGPAGVDATPASVIAWGTSSGADMLGWLTTGSDPDTWPVLVWKRHGSPQWQIHDCGMTEFLRRLFTRDFADCPLSDASLWGDPSPHFVHWREERRRYEAGIDPYTGQLLPWHGADFT
ncbi:hypothetical protein ACFV4F_07585 [Kitasatospora sp. NPDC059722]|uniref:hypothetical protein n=1 Tax=Kitasatospora sp. NPDC059722 TaxID=3346925 RepID=UPI003686853F